MLGEDCTPHRVVLPFSEALTVEKAESFAKYLSFVLQGKSICFDATRLWFTTLLENRESLALFDGGYFVNETIKPELGVLNQNIQKEKKERLESLLQKKVNQPVIDEPIRQTLNKLLVEYAKSVGFDVFFNHFNVEFVESNRGVENRAGDLKQLVERFDVKPPDSETKDRVNCHLTEDNYLIFYDRRDGKNGYSGSLIQFLCKCEFGGLFEPTYEQEIDKAKKLFSEFGLDWLIVYPKRVDLLWEAYLKDNASSLMYIKQSSIWCFYNGKFWEKLNKESQLNHFVSWCRSTYGFVSGSHLKDVKSVFRSVHYDLVVVKDKLPRDRYKFAFNDGVYDSEEKVFLEHSPEHYIYSCFKKNYNDFSIDKGREVYNNLFYIIQNVIKGDERQHNAFMQAFTLMVGSYLHKSKRAIWAVGDGGSGKSFMQNLVRMMHGGKSIDMNPESLFDSKHALVKLLDGDSLLLSEFVLPRGKGEFLKDLIAPNGVEKNCNLVDKDLGAPIAVDPKFGIPYTDYIFLDVFIVSQTRSNAINASDSGWVRRAAYFDFKKVNKSDKYLPFQEVYESLGDLFVYLLSLDMDYVLQMFESYCDGKQSDDMKTLQLENSVPAQYLNEHLEPTNELIPLNQIWQDFEKRKGSEYGTPNYTKKSWLEGLKSAIDIFGQDDDHRVIHTIGGNFYLYYAVKSFSPEISSNGNGKKAELETFRF